MLIFKNKPDTSTPINASNLNANFEELDGNIGDLGSLETSDKTNIVDAINELNDDIKVVEYTQTYSVSTGSGTYGRVAFNTNTPSGYEWVGYVIISNGYVNSAVT